MINFKGMVFSLVSCPFSSSVILLLVNRVDFLLLFPVNLSNLMWWPLHFDFLPYAGLRGGKIMICFVSGEHCEHVNYLEKGQWFIEENWIAKPFSSPKSTAWLSLNNWLFISFHHTQRPNPETTWATNVGCGWDHHWMCHSLLTTHKTHWLQLYEVKMLKKRKMWRRCPQSFLFSREKKKKRKLKK